MTKRKSNGHARPVKTKRDYEGASAVAKRLSGQADRDSAAELRLQSLLRELDKFDEFEEEMNTDPESHPELHRRWSDNGSGDD
jgi:hypothetical protein